jgi:hypothetical protein
MRRIWRRVLTSVPTCHQRFALARAAARGEVNASFRAGRDGTAAAAKSA